MFGKTKALNEIKYELARFSAQLNKICQRIDDLDGRVNRVPDISDIRICVLESLDEYKKQMIDNEVKIKNK